MLGDSEVSGRDQTKLPGMGISKWRSLLVYQWDDLSGRGAGLAEQDEPVPTMQGIRADFILPLIASPFDRNGFGEGGPTKLLP